MRNVIEFLTPSALALQNTTLNEIFINAADGENEMTLTNLVEHAALTQKLRQKLFKDDRNIIKIALLKRADLTTQELHSLIESKNANVLATALYVNPNSMQIQKAVMTRFEKSQSVKLTEAIFSSGTIEMQLKAYNRLLAAQKTTKIELLQHSKSITVKNNITRLKKWHENNLTTQETLGKNFTKLKRKLSIKLTPEVKLPEPEILHYESVNPATWAGKKISDTRPVKLTKSKYYHLTENELLKLHEKSLTVKGNLNEISHILSAPNCPNEILENTDAMTLNGIPKHLMLNIISNEANDTRDETALKILVALAETGMQPYLNRAEAADRLLHKALQSADDCGTRGTRNWEAIRGFDALIHYNQVSEEAILSAFKFSHTLLLQHYNFIPTLTLFLKESEKTFGTDKQKWELMLTLCNDDNSTFKEIIETANALSA